MSTKKALVEISGNSEISQYALELFLERTVSAYVAGKNDYTTLGVELEFFLEVSGKPVNFMQSQEFLRCLMELPSWTAYPHDSERILKVSVELPNGRYHTVKYEHPPHLLELATAPTSTPIELFEALTFCFESLNRAATRSGVSLNFSPQIEPPTMDWQSIFEIDKRYLTLRDSRNAVAKRHPGGIQAADFPTYLAATHFHVGGRRWWLEPAVIDRLYRLEPIATTHGASLLSCDDTRRSAYRKTRADVYRSTFGDHQLLNYPAFDSWDLAKWIDALLDSSVTLDKLHKFFGMTVRQASTEYGLNVMNELLFSARDLQIIKPKSIGTIEFRADPTLSTPLKILTQAKFRAAIFNIASSSERLDGISYAQSRMDWEAQTLSPNLSTLALSIQKRATASSDHSPWNDI